MEKIKPSTRGPKLAEYKRQLVLTQRQRDILTGVLLGDCSLNTQNNGKTFRVAFEQGKQHFDYLHHLFNEFDSWCLSPPHLKIRESQVTKGKKVETKEFRTLAHESFTEFADLFLELRPTKKGQVKRVKVVKPNTVRDYVTPVSLAYWFMDDGGKLDYTKNQGKGIILHTQGFTKKEVTLLAEELAIKFNLQSKATKMKGKYVVSISGYSFERFLELTEPHIILSMRAKLPSPRETKERS